MSTPSNRSSRRSADTSSTSSVRESTTSTRCSSSSRTSGPTRRRPSSAPPARWAGRDDHERGATESRRRRRGAARALDAAEADGFTRTSGSSVVDRVLYALFARHASDRRHDADRKRYRGTALDTGFETHLARVYGLSWLVCVAVIVPALLVAASTVPGLLAAADAWIGARSPVPIGSSPERVAVAAGLTGSSKRATVRLGGLHLRWLTATRRTDIERTLPPAVRYLELLAAGSDGPGKWSRRPPRTTRTAGPPPRYGRRSTPRDSPGASTRDCVGSPATRPRELLAPFLLKFRKHAATGDAALAEYLRTEESRCSRTGTGPASAPGDSWSFSPNCSSSCWCCRRCSSSRRPRSVVVPELLPPVDTPVGVVPTRRSSSTAPSSFSLLSASSVRSRSARSARRTSARATTCRRSPQNPRLGRAQSVERRGRLRAARGAARGRARVRGYTRQRRAALVRGVRGSRRRRRGETHPDRRREGPRAGGLRPRRLGTRRAGAAVPRGGRGGRARRGPRRARRRRGRPRVRAPVDDRDGGAGSTERARDTGSTGASAQSPGVRAAAIDRFVQRVGTPLAEGTLGLVTPTP